MNFFDDENKIIQWFQDLPKKDIYPVDRNRDTIKVLKTIHSIFKWHHWKNSSGKDAPPPDFYSPKYKLMMEVMRIDDHVRLNKKGKLENPVNMRESQIQQEIRNKFKENGIEFNSDVIVISKPTLPSYEDHNYKMYRDSFIRIVNHHKERISLYKQNHPGYKLIFFVMDESTAYNVSAIPAEKVTLKADEPFEVIPHIFWKDKVFVDVIANSGVDYFVWYAPYKLIQTQEGILPLPKAVVYNLETYKATNLYVYDADYMISCEE